VVSAAERLFQVVGTEPVKIRSGLTEHLLEAPDTSRDRLPLGVYEPLTLRTAVVTWASRSTHGAVKSRTAIIGCLLGGGASAAVRG
jgi:hypothetical protein